jgi:hypothetical protein
MPPYGIGGKPTLSLTHHTTGTHVKEWHAFTNLMLNFRNINKVAFMKGIVTKALGNITISAHALNVRTVRAVVATNFVMSLRVTNYE